MPNGERKPKYWLGQWAYERGINPWAWGEKPPEAPAYSPPPEYSPIGELTPETYLALLKARFTAEEAAEFDDEKRESLKKQHDWEMAEAARMLDAGIWGTAEQFALPRFDDIQKSYAKWAGGMMPEEVPTELTPWEEWQKEKAMLPYEQMTAAQQAQLQLGRQELAWERQQAMQMTPWQQAQQAQWGVESRLAQMQEATRLAGLGDVGWIEQWYAQQAQQARFPQREPSPWYMGGRGLAGIAGWEGMRPEERGEWLRRKEKGMWAGMHPEVQEMVEAGYGWPKAMPGAQFGYGETWPGFAEAPQPEWEAARGTTSQFLPTKTISIKPTGEISIKEDGGMPERGRAGQEPTPTSYRDVYLGRPAPTAPIGEAPPRKGRARARPRPTAPPFPEELQPFLPAGIVGQPIERGWQMPTPSAQLWGRTPPSVRGKLAGYAQYGDGLSYEDLMWRQQQRQMPTRAGRWGAARQWT